MKNRAFNFVEKGFFAKNVEEMRKKANAKELGIDLATTQLTEAEHKDLLQMNLDVLRIRQRNHQPLKIKTMDLIPEVEWWDAYFLPADKKSFSPYWQKDSEGNFIHNIPSEIKFDDFFPLEEKDFLKEKVTIYVQHPITIKNETMEKKDKVILPTFLTEKEKKKFRRLRRLEKEKDKQEKVRLGLIKPDPPKLKFNNFMRIIGDAAVQDPSQIEKKVRKAYEQRYNKMMKENEARKLTPEKKAEKIKKKFEKDSKKEVRACLFKIEDLSQKKNKYQIDKNSQQLYLTGVCMMNRRKKQKIENSQANNVILPNLVYAEGGPLAIKKFKNLLLRRIKWDNSVNDDEIKEDDNNTSQIHNQEEYKINKKCLLVWEGTLKKRYFEKFKMYEISNENSARKILGEKGIEHFWNLVCSYKLE